MIDARHGDAYQQRMGEWIGMIEDQDGVRGWVFRDGKARSPATGLTADDILAQLDADDVLAVPASRHAQALPAKLLPDALPLLDLAQENPPARLSVAQRLQLAGYQAQHPDWDGVVVLLDARHSHWCLISAAELVGLQTFLTPRLIDALQAPSQADQPALLETLSRPERLAAHLALSEANPEAITGHLIGAELGAARAWWLGQQVAVIGPVALANAYATGLASQGVPAITVRDTTPDGLAALRSHLG
ncbi:2-dehydro-3-deoxygalactonokinase [Thalassovita sp.]|uniref:2-dehydro-3-deoxygalactonokinase n=1 Tax=Thalassovita sp. TaxID=1979401 RepID=UPI0029DE822E|nr:2-dehydro-3-deoxygalactonokinase [Thalassovita sp.]